MRILMVCLGNICRSPLAEGILRSKVFTDAVTIDSAGTSGFHQGELPDPRSIAVAKSNGIDITYQRSRKFTVEDFDNFDLIYAMDQSNYQNLLDIARNKDDESKIKMILNESNPGENLNVPDPYYGGDKGFDNVFRMLDEACDVIASKFQ
ncbi:low molecular weight protein-tyrosine-phosphatase [Tenacibaculum sp. MEBiC06402]|uniref:low molecular weight protein-tyrosine-phosphatase n=1 Tax=unclassified Tenacibaculum TaxID=2635139 RepID=UPI003B9D1F70